MSVDMMGSAKIEAGLNDRLVRLTGEGPECCAVDYRGLGRKVAQTPSFARALARARALADERRLTALALLRRRRELCACEIQASLGVTHATVSHHMGILVAVGLVTEERRGKWMYYRLGPGAKAAVP